MNRPTEQDFVAQYEDPIARRIAREAYRAMHPAGMHTNGPTMVRIEVSQLLRVLAKWKRVDPESLPDAEARSP